MAQSLTSLLTHIVFGTKNKITYLDDEINHELYLYIAKILQNHNCQSLRIGGTDDHIHILCIIAKNLSVGKIVEEIKTSSSKWIKTKGLKYQEFYWQPGYGAFSVSSSHRDIVCDYISNQKQHHKKITFIDEFYSLLKKYNVEIDNRYSLD
jgi:putative transposase